MLYRRSDKNQSKSLYIFQCNTLFLYPSSALCLPPAYTIFDICFPTMKTSTILFYAFTICASMSTATPIPDEEIGQSLSSDTAFVEAKHVFEKRRSCSGQRTDGEYCSGKKLQKQNSFHNWYVYAIHNDMKLLLTGTKAKIAEGSAVERPRTATGVST